jgi:hypothetical protein
MSRPPKPPPPRPPKPPPPPPGIRPRTFKKVVAANLQDPFHAARIARLNRGERFDDPAVSDPNMREVSVHPDVKEAAIGLSNGAMPMAAAT